MLRRITLTLAFLISPLLAKAQPLADRLPGDTLVYLGWRGADSLGPGYEGSHLKAVLDSSNFSQLINDFLPAVLQKIGQQDQQAAQVLPILSAIARPMWKHPSAYYFGGIDFPAGGQPMPRIALLCDAGADGPELLKTLQNLAGMAQGAPVPIQVKEFKGIIAVTVGKMSPAFDAVMAAAAGGEAQALTGDKGFKDALGQTVSDPAIALYVNFEGVLATVDQAMKTAPAEVQSNWIKARDGLGLTGLKRLVYAAGFDNKDWVDSAFIAAPAPRTGLLKMFGAAPLSGDAFKVAPKTSVYVAAAKFNFAGFVAGIREGITQFNPQLGQQVDNFIQQASQAVGVDLQKDVLGAFGDEWVTYTDPATGGYGLVGTVLVNHLANAASAEASFSKVEGFLNNLIASQLQREKMTIAFQTQKVGDLTIHYLPVPMLTPTWAIRDGNFYFSLYPQGVIAGSSFVAKKGASILENEDFVALRKRLGTDKADGVEYIDLVKQAPINYGSWVALSRIVGFADLFGIKSPLMVLPPMSDLMANLGPAGGVSWSDDAGFHLKSLSPFPGSTVLTTDPISAYMTSVAPVAFSASILLPSLSRARLTANRVKSASNLRQIGQGCMLYANENNGAMPPDIAALLKTQDLTVDVFSSPLSNQQIPSDVRAMNRDQQAAWAQEHSDYVYIAKGKKNTMGADEPVAYEKPEIGEGQGINILFGDFHVEFLTMPAAEQILQNVKK